MTQQTEAQRLADALTADDFGPLTNAAAAELRRLEALYEQLLETQLWQASQFAKHLDRIAALEQANEAFGKRQEWWDGKMWELEQANRELLATLERIAKAAEATVCNTQWVRWHAREAIAKHGGLT